MKTLSFKVSLVVLSLALAGCAQKTVPVAAEPDLVSTRIAAAAEKASSALDTISGIEQQRTPIAPPQEDFSNAPPQLQEPVSVRWSGPIDQLCQTLASRAGMQFRVIGSRPPVPLTVTVDAYQKPIVEILRDLGLQAGRRADLRLDGVSGVLELRYAPADRL